MEHIGLLANLQSLMVGSYYTRYEEEVSITQVRHIICDKLGPGSHLKRVEIKGQVLHLADGQWLEVPPTSRYQHGN